MPRLNISTPCDYSRAAITGWTRRHWEEIGQRLVATLVLGASAGGARQRIPGPRSHHGAVADELEGFTRSMFFGGVWLRQSPDGACGQGDAAVDLAAFYRRGILAGTDPRHPEYWGRILDYSQHLVEMAALAWGLYLGRRTLWDPCSPAERQRIGDYLFQCTRARYHQNNWLLFNVVVNAVLKRLGMPYSQDQIDGNLAACEKMYLGGGWYRDGDINRIDYYNAWGFLFYQLLWVIVDGDSRPDAAARYKERARLFARDLRYFVAADGSVPSFGRSAIYRCALVGPVALGQYLRCLDLAAGEAKTLCNAVARFFFGGDILTAQGHLSPGFVRERSQVVEPYSCGGSPYWATKAFSVLLMPVNDPFWTEVERPLPVHAASFAAPLRPAGLLLVGDAKTGHVQLLNHKSSHDRAEFKDRYTKLAYSSAFGYDARDDRGRLNCDNALQWRAPTGAFDQRGAIEPLYCEAGFAASRSGLGAADPSGVIYTSVVVKDDFMVNIHYVETTKRLVFREGGYALGFDEGSPEVVSVVGAEAVYGEGRVSFIRNLAGYVGQLRLFSFGDETQGPNTRHRHSVVPALEYTSDGSGGFCLVSLVCGRTSGPRMSSLMELVTAFELRGRAVKVSFYDGESAHVQMGRSERADVVVNGRVFSGEIVMARASAGACKWFVLYRDGSVDTSAEPVEARGANATAGGARGPSGPGVTTTTGEFR